MRRVNEAQTRKEIIDPQLERAGVVVRVVALRGRMGDFARQVEGLFESLLSENFNS